MSRKVELKKLTFSTNVGIFRNIILMEKKQEKDGKSLSAEFDHLFFSHDMIEAFKTGRLRKNV